MMDSDDDDIYPEHHEVNGTKSQGEVKMEDAEDGEEGEEVEEESDDDVDFIIDADAKDEPQPDQAGPGSQQPRQRPSSLAPAAADNLRKSSLTPTPAGLAVKPGTPAAADATRGDSQPPTMNDRPGTEYPARHTSKIDPNGNPVHPATGKPILSTDFDVDFPTESSKPWRKPGADITDYFNYGFDEFTWASYCLKQQQMPKEVKEITQQAEQLKAFVEGIPGGGMPGMPPMPGPVGPGVVSGGPVPGPGPGPGPAADMSQMAMPSDAQMQQMFAAMTSQGLDPSSMDPAQFMQFMAAGGAGIMGQPQPPAGPAGGYGGGGGGGGGFDQGGGGGGGFGRGRGKGGRRNW
ncbi:hypothetical protein A1O1_02684 [Capronia coronata CBS 617.96]|uniref:Pre-mRNA polyadenylation factor Fip1 domain-containing protein n=1 Tax=Capronia coronata CBS 617.96 TaxID=1182541 RepID=W9YX65_9EURO|nr:uncharacterized protein A1O1_02684 [Capronia coronata CBS 617.96]EXJ94290.1 hypothetical protein A1O1_02684 [Capronia coronata CBS 617.96]